MSNHPEVTFFVNDEAIVVHTTSLTVREILDDAGFPVNEYVLLMHEHGNEVVYVDPEQAVTLHEGLRLRVRPRTFHIVVNGRERTVSSEVVTYEQIVALAPNLPPPSEIVEYSVTFRNAVKPHEGDLIAGESVVIKNGTQFVVSSSNRS